MIHAIHCATGHGIRRICTVLAVPRSSYYHAANPTARSCSDQELGQLIEQIFHEHRRRYGYRRIWKELGERGHTCAPDRVRRLMAERGLHAIQPRTYVPHTSDGRADAPSPNRLIDQPAPTQPNRVWIGDLTFIPTQSGWLYLALVIDLCSRRIVGWALADHMRADHMRADLVTAALQQAITSRRPPADLIFHSDRGSQYGSKMFRVLLAAHGLRQSMSARANPYHNAWCEPTAGRWTALGCPQGERSESIRHRPPQGGDASRAAASSITLTRSPNSFPTSRATTTPAAAIPPSTTSHQPPSRHPSIPFTLTTNPALGPFFRGVSNLRRLFRPGRVCCSVFPTPPAGRWPRAQ